MNRQKWIILAVVFVLIGAAAAFLHERHLHQKLGTPGVKARPIAGSPLMEISLPEHVLNYSSEPVPPSEQETNMLPKDTTIVHREYIAPDGFKVALAVVMMGTDRTSIHKPDYCLPGQGWKIEKKEEISIPVNGPADYQIPAMKWTLSNSYKDKDGQIWPVRGFYVFWFTADNEMTAHHPLWRIMREVLLTGVLPRWSYVSYFSYFPPAAEAVASARLDEFLKVTAPEIQIPPKQADVMTAAQ